MKGLVTFLNPDGLIKNPAFSNVAVIKGSVKTVYIGGQNSVNEKKEIIGKGDLKAQTEQVMKNLIIALESGGAILENIVKWNLYIVQGIPVQPAFEVFQRIWGDIPNKPLHTLVYVAAFANPDFLIEIDAIAVVSETV